nr:retrovirus-related Pol polyprotein from transposon TNT 1-94 [Tanacetum cinerariifolium]
MILNSLQNGLLVWPTVEEDGTTRTKKYEELSVAEKLQADYDLKATYIILQGLLPDVYAIVNHHKVATEIWDGFKLLMQGTKLSLQEKEYVISEVPHFEPYHTDMDNQKYFENNDLKTQIQDKDTTICKFKEHIKLMRENDKEEKVKHEMDEIETINIELEHSVAKLLFKTSNSRQGMFKIDLEPLAPRLLNNREARIDYLKHTQEQADILRGIVEQPKAKQPLDNALDFSCCPDCPLVFGLQMLKTYDKESLPAHELRSRDTNLYTITLDDMLKTSPICLLSKAQRLRVGYGIVGYRISTSNGIVERRNRTLVEAARTMLIFSKAPLFLWAEAINTTSYTQDCSLIRLRDNKTPYELMHDKKLDLSFFHVFGSLCYLTNDNEDLVAVKPRAIDIAESFVSTSINLDAPSTSIPLTQEQEHSTIISQGFEESPKTPHFHNDLLHESLNEDSTFQRSSSNVRPSHTSFEHLGRRTKDHPIANAIDDPSCSVSIRKQLKIDAMWC